MHKKVYKGMLNLKTIFEKKTNVFKGLTRDELISLNFSIPINKVIKLNRETIETKWNEIKTIKKYLLWKDSFPIIFKSMDRGTELFCDEFGKRTLKKRTNIFFRCSDIRDAGSWRDCYDKISKSIYKTGSKPMEIIEEEDLTLPIAEKIKEITR
jgi:hypothetical protein